MHMTNTHNKRERETFAHDNERETCVHMTNIHNERETCTQQTHDESDTHVCTQQTHTMRVLENSGSKISH